MTGPANALGCPQDGPPGPHRRTFEEPRDSLWIGPCRWELQHSSSTSKGSQSFSCLSLLSVLGGLFAAGSPGHLVARIRIAPIKGGALGVIAPIVRPLLITLVIPAVLVDSDMRGLHDRLVGTILVVR